MDPCLNKEQAARDAIEGLLAECADAKCDRAIARTALAEKTAECEHLRHICHSVRHGIEDTLEITERSEITIMLSGLKDYLKEVE